MYDQDSLTKAIIELKLTFSAAFLHKEKHKVTDFGPSSYVFKKMLENA